MECYCILSFLTFGFKVLLCSLAYKSWGQHSTTLISNLCVVLMCLSRNLKPFKRHFALGLILTEKETKTCSLEMLCFQLGMLVMQ